MRQEYIPVFRYNPLSQKGCSLTCRDRSRQVTAIKFACKFKFESNFGFESEFVFVICSRAISSSHEGMRYARDLVRQL